MAHSCLRMCVSCVFVIVLFISSALIVTYGAAAHRSSILPAGMGGITSKAIAQTRSINSKYKDVSWNSTDGLFIFAHISDIHISEDEKTPENNLRKFVDHHLNVLKPSCVVASGDLCNSESFKRYPIMGTIPVEWQTYSAIINVTKDMWFDVRGNHDALFAGTRSSPENLYRQYGALGSAFGVGGVIIRIVNTTAFVLVDTNVSPSLAAPWTLNGEITANVAKQLDKASLTLTGTNIETLFVAGHHPLGSITNSGPLIRFMESNNATAYLCGHYHSYGLESRHEGNFIEMLAKDHKERAFIRLFAVEHGNLVSHGDMEHDKWPLVVVTNPKSAGNLLPFEEYSLIRLSTHIRVLAYSSVDIISVSARAVSADGTVLMPIVQMTNVHNSSLYITPWDPDALSSSSSSFMTIEVNTTDAKGRTKQTKQTFSLDGSPAKLKVPGSSGFAVMPIDTLMWIFFVIAVLYVVVWKALIPLFYIVYIHVRAADTLHSWALSVVEREKEKSEEFQGLAKVKAWFEVHCVETTQLFVELDNKSKSTKMKSKSKREVDVEDAGVDLGLSGTSSINNENECECEYTMGGTKWLIRLSILVVSAIWFLILPLQIGTLAGNQFGAVFGFYGVLSGQLFLTSVTWGVLGACLMGVVNPFLLFMTHHHRTIIHDKVLKSPPKLFYKVYMIVLLVWLLISCVVSFVAILLTISGEDVSGIFLSPVNWFMVVIICVAGMSWRRVWSILSK